MIWSPTTRASFTECIFGRVHKTLHRGKVDDRCAALERVHWALQRIETVDARAVFVPLRERVLRERTHVPHALTHAGAIEVGEEALVVPDVEIVVLPEHVHFPRPEGQ